MPNRHWYPLRKELFRQRLQPNVMNNLAKQLWIPEGFAHGFVTSSESAEFLYKTTDYYAPEHERCIRWDDPGPGIKWPLVGEPQVSD